MKKHFRSLIALFLAVLMLSTLTVTAFAETETTYPDGQSYRSEDGQVEVYTVQVAAGPNLDGAERIRTYMLAEGFDCFLLAVDNGYRIMCGKFTDVTNAYRYCRMIREETERANAYVTSAQLPQAALDEFVEHYKKDPFVVGDVLFNGWETPTGSLIDMNGNEEETRTVYTVQFTGGSNFAAAEARRDELAALGFDGHVVKLLGCYIVIGGVFENREDAVAYRGQIREATGRLDSSVRMLQLPVSVDNT